MKQNRSELYRKSVIVGRMNRTKEGRTIDYYVSIPKYNIFRYAFSNGYTDSAYDFCKGGVQMERLLTERTKNRAIMRLVDQAKRMIPYLLKYEWELAA